MKRYTTLFALLLVMITSWAQNLKVRSFYAVGNDISASQYQRNDENGNPCALVKIQMVGAIKNVEGQAVGDIVDKGSEKWVYVKKDESKLQFTAANGETIAVDFSHYGIDKAESKVTYILEIEAPATMSLTKEVETITVNGVEFKMIRVDGGTFTMGSVKMPREKTDFDNLSTERQVTLPTYYIGETEVTNELWCAVLGRAEKYDDVLEPQNYVSWMECTAFVEKLSQQTGMKFRLPTEEEWEYAARGGQKSKGYDYSGSKKLKDAGWVNRVLHDVHEVKYKANELGIYDMTGNVSEWCDNGFVRGGNYLTKAPSELHVCYRKAEEKTAKEYTIGLRIAVSQ